ncbi:hypothetical protein [Wolbachia endosymbiont (group B) of Eucosma cana]|uniref:hypothetical protein n=1 Tax=Wolbachia endosymbiont (group B) of Eucosma cana TaxID=2954012 RepID=UPI002226C2C1|nr:hypothetical protein [Wolbachia endosymbiont (group B) of Eucosma cana]
MTTSIWKLKNIAPITKMGIEATFATASLAAAITTLLIATKVIAGPASLALIASPAGIAVLFITAVYFSALAISSYQQMHKNEEISNLSTNYKLYEPKIENKHKKSEGVIMTTSIWKLKNIVPITKMGVEATFAIASLATAITIIRNLKGTPPPLVFLGPSGPEFAIFIICLFAAIAVLFIAAIYFAAAACASYQQMHKNEEISELKAGAETVASKAETAASKAEAVKTEVKGKIEDLVTKNELNSKLNSNDLESKVKELLPALLINPDVVTADVKKVLQATTN